ncbi:permease [Tunturiibacter gelidiferens]|uniref:permease n=1 Tax=Tunturiibacter gelidiferens TaxID=3069689 RepID=UPI003D9BAA04
MVAAIGHALMMSFTMAWEILWALILGFWLSAIIQAVVSKEEMSRLLPDDSPRTIAVACGLGAASSSCSYAAVALARSMFRKGANFTAAMAFQFASTNLVLELGILLVVLMGWQFTLAEFTGGPLMIVIMVLLFKAFLTPRIVEATRQQAEKGLQGRMEGHAAMDMSVHEGTIWQRMTSDKGRTAISHFFVMDWVAIWIDIGAGLLIAGALAAWVPNHFWQAFFLQEHPILTKLWGPVVGPIVAILSFVCSVGNVPLAAVLWNGGISFGGVLAFLFADLIVLPILNIYRKYYGLKISGFLLLIFYISMALAALAVEFLFGALHLVPQQRKAQIVEEAVRWNYTTILNIVFLALAMLLVIRFLRTGGPAMLRMMSGAGQQEHGHAEDAHRHHGHT